MQDTDTQRAVSPHTSEEDTSDFLDGSVAEGALDLGGIFSNRFSNIMPLYSSPHGATELHTATRYGKRYILKGLKEEYRTDPLYNVAMAKEFEIGIALDHPNIRRTISLETAEGLGQVMVMEYVDGRSLESMLRDETITPEQAHSIASSIADALAYIHAHGAVHRDLKPANILISHQGDTVKVIDFSLSDSDGFFVLKNPAGSGKYIAPELLLPEARHTPEADIYSLGVLSGELAETSGSRRLAQAADICRDPDPGKRREGLRLIKEGLQERDRELSLFGFLDSRWLTYPLIAACLGLGTFIIYHYLH